MLSPAYRPRHKLVLLSEISPSFLILKFHTQLSIFLCQLRRNSDPFIHSLNICAYPDLYNYGIEQDCDSFNIAFLVTTLVNIY